MLSTSRTSTSHPPLRAGSLEAMSQEQGADVWDDPNIMLERPASTGLTRVDGVIDAVAAVGSGSLEDQVRVYEQAHAELRAALDDPDAVTADVGSA